MTRPQIRWSPSTGAALAGVCLIWAAAEAGLWWLPLALGAITGATSRRHALTTALISATGWILPLLTRELTGQPLAATAQTVASLTGTPALADVALAATVLFPAIQSAAGWWAGNALAALLPHPTPEVREGALHSL